MGIILLYSHLWTNFKEGILDFSANAFCLAVKTVFKNGRLKNNTICVSVCLDANSMLCFISVFHP